MFFFIFVYCFGFFIILLGVDFLVVLGFIFKLGDDGFCGFEDLLVLFLGGGFINVFVMVFGIMLYISVFIIMQLFGMVVFVVQKMQNEGEFGCKQINNYICIFMIIICVFQVLGYILLYVVKIDFFIIQVGIFWWVQLVVVLVVGLMFVVWLGECIMDCGIGNGIFFLIIVGIFVCLLQLFFFEIGFQKDLLLVIVLEMVVFILVVMGIILIVQGVCKILLNMVKCVVGVREVDV